MLKIGDQIPVFELMDQSGKLRKSSEFIGDGKSVIFFYPMDFTPGCSKEVCGFRDHFEDFIGKGVHVVGISADSQRQHQKFSQRYKLPFPLLSDKGNNVRKLFGLRKIAGFIPTRVTFVVDEKGNISHIINALFDYNEHVKQALFHTS